MQQTQNTSHCPCGSGKPYSQCCQPLHQGQAAQSPEALMRSRFSAFVRNLPNYLRATWHSSTRPASLSLEGSPAWSSLQILKSSQDGDSGRVHFRALYRVGNEWGFLEENSDFRKEEGRWYYLQGDTREGQFKPGRNYPCPCGSGKKHKACCL